MTGLRSFVAERLTEWLEASSRAPSAIAATSLSALLLRENVQQRMFESIRREAGAAGNRDADFVRNQEDSLLKRIAWHYYHAKSVRRYAKGAVLPLAQSVRAIGRRFESIDRLVLEMSDGKIEYDREPPARLYREVGSLESEIVALESARRSLQSGNGHFEAAASLAEILQFALLMALYHPRTGGGYWARDLIYFRWGPDDFKIDADLIWRELRAVYRGVLVKDERITYRMSYLSEMLAKQIEQLE